MKIIVRKGLLFFFFQSLYFRLFPLARVPEVVFLGQSYKHINDWLSITKLFCKSIVPIYVPTRKL